MDFHLCWMTFKISVSSRPSKHMWLTTWKKGIREEIKSKGEKLRLDDRLIKMYRKHLWLPRESCYREIITLTNMERVDSGRGLILHPRSWWLYPGNVTPVKAWLLCCLIEFTENACLQNEISPPFTVQPGSLDRISRGPFLLIKGGWEPLGAEDCKQSSSTLQGRALAFCSVVKWS